MYSKQFINLKNHSWPKFLEVVNSHHNHEGVAVIDNFLEETLALELQKKLIDHWGWHYRHPSKPHLSNSTIIDIPEVKEISLQLESILKNIDENISFCNVISLRNNNNTEGILHADNFDYTITYWVTPDRYNLDSKSGGMRVFDVSRPKETLQEELDGKYWCEEYLQKYSKGNYKDIDYKFNRAVLFKPRTLHRTNKVNFSDSSSYSNRINLTFTFNLK